MPSGNWGTAVLRFGIGDMVGVVVSMPLIWMLASAASRQRLRDTVWRAVIEVAHERGRLARWPGSGQIRKAVEVAAAVDHPGQYADGARALP